VGKIELPAVVRMLMDFGFSLTVLPTGGNGLIRGRGEQIVDAIHATLS